MDRLSVMYESTIRPSFVEDGLKNVMAIPRVTKVNVNVGLNQARLDQKKIEQIEKVVKTITGQKPTLRRARKAIAGFKIRQGDPVGLALTLRGQRMYDFLERLVRIALPRVRDFRGIPRKNFDRHGNLTIGIRELSIFPEVRYQDIYEGGGLEITIVTNAKNDKHAEKLLAGFGIPFV